MYLYNSVSDDRFYFPVMPGFVSGAYHTGDSQYIFPGYHGGPLGVAHPLNDAQEDLSDQIVAAWTNFAWTGNPNGLGNYPWPRYTGSNGRILLEELNGCEGDGCSVPRRT